MEPHIVATLLGYTVQISRSDGRVHSSVVKSVYEAKGAVMVEWLERNATNSLGHWEVVGGEQLHDVVTGVSGLTYETKEYQLAE